MEENKTLESDGANTVPASETGGSNIPFVPEPVEVPAASKGKKRVPDPTVDASLSWTNAGVYQHCFAEQNRILELDKLRWGGRDVGQMRPLSLAWVQSLKSSISCRPAAGYAECLTWDAAGMTTFYLI